jgi:hypothetical protein
MNRRTLTTLLLAVTCACGVDEPAPTSQIIKNGVYEGQDPMAYWSMTACDFGGATPTTEFAHSGEGSLELSRSGCTVKTISTIPERSTSFQLGLSYLVKTLSNAPVGCVDCLGVKVFWFGKGGLGKLGSSAATVSVPEGTPYLTWVTQVISDAMPLGAGAMRLELTQSAPPGEVSFVDDVTMVVE